VAIKFGIEKTVRQRLDRRHWQWHVEPMNKRNSDWYIPPDWRCLLAVSFLPACIAILAAMILPLEAKLQTANLWTLYGLGLCAGVASVVMLLIARKPLYKERHFWTIGPKWLDRKHRRIYWLSYAFVAVSLLLLSVVWLRAREI